MALLQIAEPGLSTAPHAHRLAVGIDLGTTHSLVATVRSGCAETLADAEGHPLLPSVVRYLSDGAVVVGELARTAEIDDPFNTISSVKRLMGRGLADAEGQGTRVHYRFAGGDAAVPRIDTVMGSVTAVEISAEILRVLKQRAEQTLGGELSGAVITVPAYFDDAQRQATKDAARLAGLEVFRLLNEPTAAAVAYGLDHGTEGVIAVYDLGGGTFDLSILRLHRGVFEVLATAGDTALGGDDMDRAVADWVAAQVGLGAVTDPSLRRLLLHRARTAKEMLSQDIATFIDFPLVDGSFWRGELTREVYEGLIDPLIGRSLEFCRRALRDADISLREVNDVIMVGGATRTPRVRARVGELFDRAPRVDLDPDKVVALGAALQADILAGNKPDSEMLLLDVIPLSLGIETMGGLVEKIIPRNSTIPVARAQEFTTYKDGQTALAIHVVQGERELVADCRSLARFELRGIPPMTAGAARIRVTFQVDADGLLAVTAQEKSSGVRARVAVKPSYGLTDDEIEHMLRDSMGHAEHDMHIRRLREQQVEADRVLEALSAALTVDGDEFLNADERVGVEAAIGQLRAVRGGHDPYAIKQAQEALEAACEFYVERRMNASIRRAMQGHRPEEFG